MKNKKITVDVLCPSVSGKYDFEIDSGLTAGEAAGRIAEQIREYENAEFLFRSGEILLYSTCTRLPLDPLVKLEDYGITSGSRLMIIQESTEK